MKRLNLFLILAAVALVLGGTFLNGSNQKAPELVPPVGVQIGNIAPELAFNNLAAKPSKKSKIAAAKTK